jgi:hypothetical protein
MIVRPLFASLAIAFLCACSKGPSGGEPGGPVGQAPSGPILSSQAGPAASNEVAEKSIPAQQAGDLPPPGDTFRFIGKWAADQKACQTKAWQFTASALRTPAGSSCSFDKVTQVPGGYDIQATCTAEGPAAADLLKIRFAESAKAMLFDSKSIASTGLVFCGRDV